MKVIEISDELYERLKNCVVDPFDDTPEFVIGRLIEIVDKARSRWSAWQEEPAEDEQEADAAPPKRQTKRAKQQHSWNEETGPVL